MGCTDNSNSIRTLESHGFSNIRLTGYEPFACGERDTFSTGFVAMNPAGHHVTGTVCCGLIKSCTIRF